MDKRQTTPWAWIPTLYMAEGAPYFAVNTLAMLFLSEMGLSNTDVALYTSWMYLPWVIKTVLESDSRPVRKQEDVGGGDAVYCRYCSWRSGVHSSV